MQENLRLFYHLLYWGCIWYKILYVQFLKQSENRREKKYFYRKEGR